MASTSRQLNNIAVSVIRRLPASKAKVRTARLLIAAAARLGLSPDFTVRLNDGTCMILDARGRAEAEAVFTGEYERHTIDVLCACVPPGGTLVDVGANVGLIAVPLACALAPSGGRVIAFEPVAANAARIFAAARLNDVVIDVVDCALGDRNGTVQISREAGLGAGTGNAILTEAGLRLGPTSVVAMRTLDSIDEVERADVIKVDIEGAELLFLRGAMRFIAAHRPLILGEFNADYMPRFGHTFADLAPLLDAWNYKVIAWEDADRPIVVEAEAGLGNAMLVPSERLETILRTLRNAVYG